MKIRINRTGLFICLNPSLYINKYRYSSSLVKASILRLPIGRLLFLISILSGLSNLAGAQSPAPKPVTITNFISKAQTSRGSTVVHTLVLTNSGTTTATDIFVRDSTTTGLRYLTNSAVTPGGTTLTIGVPISTWSVPSLSAGHSLSLTYQAVADSSGILYSMATIPGDTASSCTSIPVAVCKGDSYIFQLTGPAGRSSYRWFKDNIELTSQTNRVLNVTAPGSYSLAVDSVANKCPGFSCCPFIIAEYDLPVFQASTVPPGCSGSAPDANGRIRLAGFNPADTYQYSAGADFDPTASLSGEPKVIPADGLLTANLANPATSKPYTIRVYNASGCYTDKTVTLVPAACCNITPTVTPGSCEVATNTFSNTVIITVTNPPVGVLTITDGPISQTVAVTTGSTTFTAVFSHIASNGASHTVIASLPGCSTVSTTYTAPASCSVTPAAPVVLTLKQVVDKSKAKPGELVSYTIVLTNTSVTSATTTTVQLAKSAGLHYVVGSAIPPAGTTFNPGLPSTWTVTSLEAGQSLSLTFQATADSSGILYNTATIPGDTARVCTSVPVKVCTGQHYSYPITAVAGHRQYRWFRTFQGVTTELTSFTTNVLNVTQPGEYTLTTDNLTGKCPDFSCCPFIVEEDSLPTFQAKALPVTCVGNTAQANGQLVLTGFQPTNTYQYSLGTSFNTAASLSGTARVIPAGGVLASNLANPTVAQAYTIRVYNASGCYTDKTVTLVPTVCSCPAEVCVPFVISQSKRAKRIGDPQ